jgi:hypothetical protein
VVENWLNRTGIFFNLLAGLILLPEIISRLPLDTIQGRLGSWINRIDEAQTNINNWGSSLLEKAEKWVEIIKVFSMGASLFPGGLAGLLFHTIFYTTLFSLVYWGAVAAVIHFFFGLSLTTVVWALLASFLVPLIGMLASRKFAGFFKRWLLFSYGFLAFPLAAPFGLVFILLFILWVSRNLLIQTNAAFGRVIGGVSARLQERGTLRALALPVGIAFFLVGNALQFAATFFSK